MAITERMEVLIAKVRKAMSVEEALNADTLKRRAELCRLIARDRIARAKGAPIPYRTPVSRANRSRSRAAESVGLGEALYFRLSYILKRLAEQPDEEIYSRLLRGEPVYRIYNEIKARNGHGAPPRTEMHRGTPRTDSARAAKRAVEQLDAIVIGTSDVDPTAIAPEERQEYAASIARALRHISAFGRKLKGGV